MPDLLDNQLLYKEETFRIIGCAMKVHRELGCGFLEAVYQEALEIEFKKKDVLYIRESPTDIYYDNIKLSKKYIADFICFNKIILELKAVNELNNIHVAQVFNYLKASKLKLGLLINFGESSLKHKRIITTQ